MNEFSSLFAVKIMAFLDYREARGYKRETYLRHLMKFDQWCVEKCPGKDMLDRETVHAWIDDCTGSGCGTPQKARALRQFGKYLRAVGEDAYVLPDKYAPFRSRSVPYLFTDSEMTALFRSIDALPPTSREPYLNEILPVMFRLIYTCGLRPNEGRELLEENVSLDTGEILITHTKHNKERVVVMSDDMLRFARKYRLRREIFAGSSLYFFPSACGGALKTETVYSAFNRAWSHANLPVKKTRRIRVYDLSYPNLNKIQTFQKKDVNRNKYRLKRFGFYFWCMIPL